MQIKAHTENFSGRDVTELIFDVVCFKKGPHLVLSIAWEEEGHFTSIQFKLRDIIQIIKEVVRHENNGSKEKQPADS